MFLFFAAYFHLLRHPAYPSITMPLTVVDALVPFYPPALLIYASLWFYVAVPPALLLGLRDDRLRQLIGMTHVGERAFWIGQGIQFRQCGCSS